MTKKILVGVCTLTLAVAIACGKSQNPTAPSAALLGDAGAAADGSTLKVGAPTLISPLNFDQTDNPDSTPMIFNNVSLKYAPNVAITYEIEVKNNQGVVILDAKFPKQAGDTSTFNLTTKMVADTIHTWRVRATNGSLLGPWSNVGEFESALGEGIFGKNINDTLTKGKTFGVQRGGRFIDGQGWQALTVTDVIDYDIPTCSTCTVEFDVTNIGPREGQCCNADLKFLSMGDSTSMGSFGAFRDNQWKMHFIQRADFDNGLEIVWRNGGTDPDGNPGDHRIKMNDGGPDFKSTYVTHWVLHWDPDGYEISGSTNGGPLIEYMSDGFGGLPYAPPNHRIELGCFPRAESIPGAIFRNFKVLDNLK